MIKTILTDLGNVVLYFDFSKMIQRLSERSGLLDVTIRQHLTSPPSIFTAFSRGALEPREFYDLMCAGLGMEIDFEEFREVWCNIFTPNYKVIELWKELRGCGYKIVLLSNLDKLHYEWVNKYFVLNFLDDAIYSFTHGCVKPNRKIFRVASERYGCVPDETVFVDDLALNILAARKFGFSAIQYDGNFIEFLTGLEKLGVKIR